MQARAKDEQVLPDPLRLCFTGIWPAELEGQLSTLPQTQATPCSDKCIRSLGCGHAQDGAHITSGMQAVPEDEQILAVPLQLSFTDVASKAKIAATMSNFESARGCAMVMHSMMLM